MISTCLDLSSIFRMFTLGLDISTSCTGVAIIDQDSNLVYSTAIILTKYKDKFEKATQVKKVLYDLTIKYYISHVFVEQNLQAFRPGLSSARTICTLAQFNGIVQYIANSIFGIQPIEINVNRARKVMGFSIQRKVKDSVKQQVFDQVTSRLSAKDASFSWPTRPLKSGPRKGQIVLVNGCTDISDAYVIACAGNRINEHTV